MQPIKITSIILSIFLISACTATKRSTKTTIVTPTPQTPVVVAPATQTPVTNAPTNVQTAPKTSTQTIASAPSQVNAPASPFTSSFMTKPSNGIYAPRKEELAAIQQQFPKVTMEKLTEGYDIYAKGACTNCHKPKAIYEFNETEWKEIIVDMAQKARMSEEQEEEVYLYVLSIKATQSK